MAGIVKGARPFSQVSFFSCVWMKPRKSHVSCCSATEPYHYLLWAPLPLCVHEDEELRSHECRLSGRSQCDLYPAPTLTPTRSAFPSFDFSIELCIRTDWGIWITASLFGCEPHSLESLLLQLLHLACHHTKLMSRGWEPHFCLLLTSVMCCTATMSLILVIYGVGED